MALNNKKKLTISLFLLGSFLITLIFFFMPIFPEVGKQERKNCLDYLDNLYNTISKGSAYYIPKVKKEIQVFNGKVININLNLTSEKTTQQITQILDSTGISVVKTGNKDIQIEGDWGKILETALLDSDLMYHNKGAEIKAKYQGLEEKDVLHAWWQLFKFAEKDLNRQKHFVEAKAGNTVQQKAIECSYNYYGIHAQAIQDKLGQVILSLIFYVGYTVWYGFGFMYLFEGMGLRL